MNASGPLLGRVTDHGSDFLPICILVSMPGWCAMWSDNAKQIYDTTRVVFVHEGITNH